MIQVFSDKLVQFKVNNPKHTISDKTYVKISFNNCILNDYVK